MKIIEAKKEVLYWAKKGYTDHLVTGTSGNISVLLPEDNLIIITPSSVRYDTMSLEDIVVVNYNGDKIEGRNNPSSELKLHMSIYKCNLAKSVVHTHSPFASAFAVCQTNIPLVLIEMIPFLGGEVECTPFALPGSEELATNTADGLKKKKVCLLANHGVVAIGETINQAYIRAEYVEDAAKICKLAMIGGEINTITL